MEMKIPMLINSSTGTGPGSSFTFPVSDCAHAYDGTMAELSSCNTDQMACEAKNIYCLGFCRKCLLVPGGDGLMLVKFDRGRMGSLDAGGATELLLSRGSVSSAALRGSVLNSPPASAGDTGDVGSIPGSGRSLGEGSSNPLQYSCLGEPMDGGAWRATVHGVPKSQTRLSMRLPSQAPGWGGAGRGGGRPLLVPGGTADGRAAVIVCTGEFTSPFLTSIQRDAFGN